MTTARIPTRPCAKFTRTPISFRTPRRRLATSFSVALLVTILAASPTLAAQIIDLGTLGGPTSHAYDINSSGQITGQSDLSGSGARGFIWQNGVMTSLGSISGTDNFANSINSSGQITGTSNGGVPFIWQNGLMAAVNPPSSWPPPSGANAINDLGAIVGATNTSGYHPYLWQNGNEIILGDINGGNGGGSQSINSSNQVVGYNYVGSDYRAVEWDGNTITDLGTLGGNRSLANSINDSGQIVGWAADGNGDHHAFNCQGGPLVDLGTLAGGNSSIADDVNNLGVIVGTADAGGGVNHAVIWMAGLIADLNNYLPAGSGWTLTEANAINDNGQIVGYGVHNGQEHGFLMAVPEPTTWVLGAWAIGVIGAVAIRRRMRRKRRRKMNITPPAVALPPGG